MTCMWKKVENEAGYPCYITKSGKQEYNHPQFVQILDSLDEFNSIKYSVYRTAFKVYTLQKHLQVPPVRISSGVFSQHRLSLSESSLALDATELEAVLADIYFAAEKEGFFKGDVDSAVDLLLNLLLNVCDSERKEPVRVHAAKNLLIVLSDDKCSEKWQALANCVADHNQCISVRRLNTLLSHITALPNYLGDNEHNSLIQFDVDSCFSNNAGMLGITASSVADWGPQGCSSSRWLPVLSRLHTTRHSQSMTSLKCSFCSQSLAQVLKFKCEKCSNVYFCEKCYLYDNELTVSGHKKSHLIREIIEGEIPPSECLGFIKGVKKMFFCSKSKKLKNIEKNAKKLEKPVIHTQSSVPKISEESSKPTIFTSTVGKASGHSKNPAVLLQDIIYQLEAQNRALKNLSNNLNGQHQDDNLKVKVDLHWDQISVQITRLKLFKENLALATNCVMPEEVQNSRGNDGVQAFDLFSPITNPQDDKMSKISDNIKNQPRVLSLDSGNFSVVSKPTVENNQPLMNVSGDTLKPFAPHATSDSISTVSMNDISTWYNESEQINVEKKIPQTLNSEVAFDVEHLDKDGRSKVRSDSLCFTKERYDADLHSVATSNDKMKELNADLDIVLDRLQQILSNNFAFDDSCFDNTQLRETASEMEGLLGSLIRGVEQRATLKATKTAI